MALKYSPVAEARFAMAQDPPKLPVRAAQAIFYFEGLAGGDRGATNIPAPLPVIGMDSVDPALPKLLLQSSSRECKP
jgi:hypothetical protein